MTDNKPSPRLSNKDSTTSSDSTDSTDSSDEKLNNSSAIKKIGKLDLTKLQNTEQSVPVITSYQKLRFMDWPPVAMIDKSFNCIFCNGIFSPRSIIPITKKSSRLEIESPRTPRAESPRIDSTPKKCNVEYSCSSCANTIRSTTNSPRTLVTEYSKSSPAITPRDKKQNDKMERRLSNSGNVLSSTLLLNRENSGSSSPSSVPSSPSLQALKKTITSPIQYSPIRNLDNTLLTTSSPMISPLASPANSPSITKKKLDHMKKKLSRSKTIDSHSMNEHLAKMSPSNAEQ